MESSLRSEVVAMDRHKLDALRKNLNTVIQGKADAVDVLVTALIAGGSVLMEDVPGVGKTTLAKALAKSIDAEYNRVQFTPDLLPADILGSSIYNPVNGTFSFRPGPIFCNVLLADEINRASPRTQSSLLEAMSERQATIEGVRHVLPGPFLVLATENPVEFHGTYPLPEAQMDRFLVRLHLGYPDAEAELEILRSQSSNDPIDDLDAVVTKDDIVRVQRSVRLVHVEDSVAKYIIAIANATRHDSRLRLGVSPRGSLMLHRAAQAVAYLAGRGYVLPDDVQRMAPYVLPHRLMLTSKAKYGGEDKASLVAELCANIKAPT